MNTLPTNSILQGGKYKIQSVLGQGGFGITYLAEQVMLGRMVAIKEFFMKEYCARDEATSRVTIGTEGGRETVERFRAKFLKEARNIARLTHPGIVRIIEVFEENATAYYVMEYAVGGSLAHILKRSGPLPEPDATRYILQVAEALAYIHRKQMNHLDVKPANIMLNENGDAILIDFGLSKQYDATTGRQTSTTPVGISDGYAPMEQYKPGGVGEFSPETDIYALGATFFKLLTGITPPSASDIYEDGVPVDELKGKGVSQKAIDVICKAMQGRKKDRLKNAQAFIGMLSGDTPSEPTPKQPDEEDNEATVAFVENKSLDNQLPSRDVEERQHIETDESDELAEEMAQAEKDFAKAMEDQKRGEQADHEKGNEVKTNEQKVEEITLTRLWKNVLVAIVALVVVSFVIDGIQSTFSGSKKPVYSDAMDTTCIVDSVISEEWYDEEMPPEDYAIDSTSYVIEH